MEIEYETIDCREYGVECVVTITAQVIFSEPRRQVEFEERIREIIEEYEA